MKGRSDLEIQERTPKENVKNEKGKRAKVHPKAREKSKGKKYFKTLNKDGTFKELKKGQDGKNLRAHCLLLK